MGQCSPGAASKEQMVRYDQDKNPIYATYRYSQNSSDVECSIILPWPVVFERTANNKKNNTQECIMVSHRIPNWDQQFLSLLSRQKAVLPPW